MSLSFLRLRSAISPQDAPEPITKKRPGGLPLAGSPAFYRFSPTGAEIKLHAADAALERFPGAPLPIGAHDVDRHTLSHQLIAVVLPIHYHHVVLHGNRSFLSFALAFLLAIVYNRVYYDANESFSYIP